VRVTVPGDPSLNLDDIRKAAAGLARVARHTPLLESETLGQRLAQRVYLKAENLQRTGSFKIRGAFNRVAALAVEERGSGVVAASAGNHGQGVALAARLLGVPATIVLPESATITKIGAIQALGARTVLFGASYEAAYERAIDLARSARATFVHPFDDWRVIAGQGTVGLEIVDDLPEVGAILVPVGGGGLIAGVALTVRALRPGARVIGVQAAGASAAVASFNTGQVICRPAETIADGIRVARPGERTFEVIRGQVDEMVAVSEEEIYRAVIFLLEDAKCVVEPAGAVGVAALLAGKVALPAGMPIVAILSGGNVDPNLLRHLIDYGLFHAGRLLLIRVRLPDRPGELARLLRPLVEKRANIREIEHHREAWGLPVDLTEVLLHVETHGPEHRDEILTTLTSLGFDVEEIQPA
jgi:threonine dehydratase